MKDLPLKFFIDIPPIGLKFQIQEALENEGCTIVDELVKAHFVVQSAVHTRSARPFSKQRLIWVGNFSGKENVPRNALLIDLASRKVLLPNGERVLWRQYLHEFAPITHCA